MELIADLLELALIETDFMPEEVHEALVERSVGSWSVRLWPADCQVFFMERDGRQTAYHTHWYEQEVEV
jgi:hypothetical protein